jgi:RimJ/RimL family protein N-acetyltransferase
MIKIRPATARDSRDLFNWRNDKQTRLASISQSKVEWPDHERWLATSLAGHERYIYIADLTDQNGGVTAVGMCRFDVKSDSEIAEVSINLNPAFRGKRLAAPVLHAAMERFLAEHDTAYLNATIRLDNAASERVFTSAGFSRRTEDSVFGYYDC